jgi:hypothetical protein
MSERELQHERDRFGSMSITQLQTRLSRVTNSNKLLNFAIIAEEFGYGMLATQARNKFEELYSHSVGGYNPPVLEVSGAGYSRGQRGTQVSSTTRSRAVGRNATIEIVEDPEEKKRKGKRVIRI